MHRWLQAVPGNLCEERIRGGTRYSLSLSCCTQPPSPTLKHPTGSESWGGGVSQTWRWLWLGFLPTIPGLTRPLHLELPFDEVELSGSLKSSSGVEVLCNGVEPGTQLPLLLSFCQLSVLGVTVRHSWNLEVFRIPSEGSKPCCPEGKSSYVKS